MNHSDGEDTAGESLRHDVKKPEIQIKSPKPNYNKNASIHSIDAVKPWSEVGTIPSQGLGVTA
jgi:hypothetical protein